MKNFKTSNIQYADEGSAPPLAPVQRLVDTLHNPLEHALIDGLGDGLDRELNLLPVLGLGHEVAAHSELGLQQGAREVRHFEAEEVAHLLGHRVVGQGGLVVGALLLEGEVAHLEDARHGLDYRISSFACRRRADTRRGPRARRTAAAGRKCGRCAHLLLVGWRGISRASLRSKE